MAINGNDPHRHEGPNSAFFGAGRHMSSVTEVPLESNPDMLNDFARKVAKTCKNKNFWSNDTYRFVMFCHVLSKFPELRYSLEFSQHVRSILILCLMCLVFATISALRWAFPATLSSWMFSVRTALLKFREHFERLAVVLRCHPWSIEFGFCIACGSRKMHSQT